MNENIKWFAAAAAVVGLSVGGVWWFYRDKAAEEPVKTAVNLPPKPVVAEDDTVPKNPLPKSDTAAALPALDDSDVPVQTALTKLLGTEAVARFVNPQDLVRHIVVTVDNLTEQKVAERLRPSRPIPGAFAVTGTEDAPVLDPANYERYKPAVQLIQSIDAKKLITVYARYYPLFQDAYESLGHPPKHFNDRLIQVVDNLLATPDVQDPIALAVPNVQYEFADPKLEALSAGQKALIRMGSANAAVVKTKLRELRAALVAKAD